MYLSVLKLHQTYFYASYSMHEVQQEKHKSVYRFVQTSVFTAFLHQMFISINMLNLFGAVCP